MDKTEMISVVPFDGRLIRPELHDLVVKGINLSRYSKFCERDDRCVKPEFPNVRTLTVRVF